jgi:WD40 repeat protein/tRNA A-37 threonylcarbamoyl transferase component Bud32
MSSDQRTELESDSDPRIADRSDHSEGGELIDSLVTRFEHQWREGLTPDPDELLTGVAEPHRSRLQLELAVVEWVYRRQRGDADAEGQMRRRYLGMPLDAFRSLASFTVTRGDRPDLSEPHATVSISGLGALVQLRCPHCGNSVDVDAEPSEDRTCSRCGQPFFIGEELPTAEKSGKQLGRFILQGRIGRGGFGTVYRAWDPQLERIVALKLPRSDLLDPVEERRFLDEARSGASLHHPNIVAVHDAGFADQTPYIVCDYIEGETLDTLIRTRRLSFRESATLIRDLAQAIEYAHSQGVIHRDVKPSNIMINNQGRPYIMDFGLARRDRLNVGITMDGEILGTPVYMSPEQAMGKSASVDARTDVYSLGAVLYVMLTGEQPFRGNPRMVLAQVIHDRPRPIRRLNDRVPRDLETVCEKAMQKLPTWRYESAAALANDLDRFLAGHPISARSTTSAQRLWLWARRSPAVAALTSAVIVLATVALIGSQIAAWKLRQANLKMTVEASRTLATIGVERLQRGDSIGLLDLLRSCDEVNDANLRDELHPRMLLTEYWLQAFEGQLQAVVGHENGVTAIAVSADGKLVATGDRLSQLRVWSVDSGQPLTDTLDVEIGEPVLSIEFSPDGRTLLATVHPKTVVVWDWPENRVESLRTLNSQLPVHLDFADRTLRGFNFDLSAKPTPSFCLERFDSLQEGAGVPELPPFNDRLIASAFSPSKQLLAVGFANGRVEVWSLDRQQLDWSAEHSVKVEDRIGLVFDREGRRLAVAYDDYTVRVFDASNGSPLIDRLTHREDVKAMAFSADGGRLATGAFDATARIVNLNDPLAAPVEIPHQGPVLHVVFSPDGRRLATGGFDEKVRVWDVSNGRLLFGPLHHFGAVTGLTFHPTKSLLFSSSQDGSARCWHLKPRVEPAQMINESGRIYSVDFSPDSRMLAIGTQDNKLAVWDISHEPKELRRYSLSSPVVAARFFPSGTAVLCSSQGQVTAFALDAPESTTPLGSNKVYTRALQFSPDGKSVISAGGDIAKAYLFRLDQSPETSERQNDSWRTIGLPLSTHNWAAAFHPSDRYFVIGDANGNVLQFAVDGCRPMQTINVFDGRINALVFCRQGAELVLAGQAMSILRFDTETWKQIEPSIQVPTPVVELAVSPDGRFLAAAMINGGVQVYELATGFACGPALQHGFYATSVAFSPDSRWLASGSFDHKVCLWRQPEPSTDDDLARLRRGVHLALGAEYRRARGEVAIPWNVWQAARNESPTDTTAAGDSPSPNAVDAR